MQEETPLTRLQEAPYLRDQAYAVIKDAILSGRFEPGERLVEQQLANRLGLSRNPVREAFRRLEQEGFLVPARGGSSVPTVSRQELHDLYAVRARLEGMAAALAAERASPQDIARLFKILDAAAPLVAHDDQAHLTEASFEFHVALYALLGNQFLKNILTLLTEQLQRYRSVRFHIPHRGRASLDEDRRIVEAIARHDPAAADTLAQEHILHLWQHAEQLVDDSTSSR